MKMGNFFMQIVKIQMDKVSKVLLTLPSLRINSYKFELERDNQEKETVKIVSFSSYLYQLYLKTVLYHFSGFPILNCVIYASYLCHSCLLFNHTKKMYFYDFLHFFL